MDAASARPTAGATPIKVVRIIARLNIGGPARHTVILDDGLRRLGFQTLLLHGSVGAGEATMEELAEARELPTLRIPTLGRRIGPADDLRAFLDLYRVLRQVKPDVVHTHTAKAGTLGRVAAALYNVSRPRSGACAVIHTFHGHVLDGYFGRLQTTAVRIIERCLASLSDCIVTISERQRFDIVERFRIAPADRVTMVPLGLELSDLLQRGTGYSPLRAELGWTEDAFVVGFVGRFVPIKDLPTLLRAMRLLSTRLPAARLLIAGDGELRSEVEDLASSLGICGSVRLLGWRRDLPAVYGAMDAFALTSRNEGTPVSLIEAMAAGVPVVATRVGGVADVVADGMTGRLVPPGQPEAVADALLQLAMDRERTRAMALAARADVAARFEATRLVEDVARLYRSAVSRKRRTTLAERADVADAPVR